MSKAQTLARLVSLGNVLEDGTIDAAEIGDLTLPAGGDIVGTTSTQTLTGKTIAYADNTLTGVLPTSAIGVTVQPYDATLLNDADIGASILPTPQVVSANYSTTSGKFLVVDTAGITITLPATPTAGDYVVIKDGTGDAATSPFTIARNGSNIAASATDLTFNKNYAEITMTYIDATIGWSV